MFGEERRKNYQILSKGLDFLGTFINNDKGRSQNKRYHCNVQLEFFVFEKENDFFVDYYVYLESTFVMVFCSTIVLIFLNHQFYLKLINVDESHNIYYFWITSIGSIIFK